MIIKENSLDELNFELKNLLITKKNLSKELMNLETCIVGVKEKIRNITENARHKIASINFDPEDDE